MVTIVLAFIALIILSAVLIPFMRTDQAIESANEESDWSQEKERLFLQLSDLEYDYQMKKVTREDYESMKAELTAKASNWLEPEANAEQAGTEVDKEIERYLEQLPRKGPTHDQ